MELGGKDACIVLEDADLDLAAGNIVKGGFSYRCVNFIFVIKTEHASAFSLTIKLSELHCIRKSKRMYAFYEIDILVGFSNDIMTSWIA